MTGPFPRMAVGADVFFTQVMRACNFCVKHHAGCATGEPGHSIDSALHSSPAKLTHERHTGPGHQ